MYTAEVYYYNYILCIIQRSIVVEFQPDTAIMNVRGNISSQTIDQSTGTSKITYNPITDKSQQMSSHISSR